MEPSGACPPVPICAGIIRDDRKVDKRAKQDLSRMDTGIQTLDPGEAIISSLKIPFLVSTRIHPFEDYLPQIDMQKRRISDGLKTGF
jgi:hypothetical protein